MLVSHLHGDGVFSLGSLLNTLSGSAPDFVFRYRAPAESIATPLCGISSRYTKLLYQVLTAKICMKYLEISSRALIGISYITTFLQ